MRHTRSPPRPDVTLDINKQQLLFGTSNAEGEKRSERKIREREAEEAKNRKYNAEN